MEMCLRKERGTECFKFKINPSCIGMSGRALHNRYSCFVARGFYRENFHLDRSCHQAITNATNPTTPRIQEMNPSESAVGLERACHTSGGMCQAKLIKLPIRNAAENNAAERKYAFFMTCVKTINNFYSTTFCGHKFACASRASDPRPRLAATQVRGNAPPRTKQKICSSAYFPSFVRGAGLEPATLPTSRGWSQVRVLH